jgi:hypothetical protein
LPIGQEDSVAIAEVDLILLESPVVLQHSILAITSVGIDEEPRNVIESNVVGFVFVYHPYFDVLTMSSSDADDVKQKMTVLQPMKGNITDVLVMGTFKWQDT